MSEIIMDISGNGDAYVNNSYPYDGETITLTCTPAEGETLDDVTATDSHGYSIALATQEEQTFVYREIWGDMTIHVIFSGQPPVPPVPESWLWAILFNRRKL